MGWGSGYENSCIHSGTIATSGDLSTVWYNYVLASAGTIFDENTSSTNPADNRNPATESVCPKGWTLPDLTQATTIIGNTGSFFPVLGGDIGNVGLENQAYGYWWTNMQNSPTSGSGRRRNITYTAGVYTTPTSRRSYGIYIRCVQKS